MTTIASPAERERLITLSTMAGTPGIIHDAIASGDIMNPIHLERAKQLGAQWQAYTSLFASYCAKEKRIDEERKRLRELGQLGEELSQVKGEKAQLE